MVKNLVTLVALVLIATSCNNHAEHKDGAADTTAKASHDHPATTATAEIPELPAIPDGAKVYFKNLKEGATVTSPIKIEMGVDNMALDTANGRIKPASGHHHILINLDSMQAGVTVPKDSTHLHYGNAQSSAEVKLAPGKYRLTLQFADALHRSYGSKLTSSVNITVQ
jgi:uncharacterized lipoprotein NlpE involved in copper resistance